MTDALGRLDPASRALLDLSLRRGMLAEDIADVLGADVDVVEHLRDAALSQIAGGLGLEGPDDLDRARMLLAELPADDWRQAAQLPGGNGNGHAVGLNGAAPAELPGLPTVDAEPEAAGRPAEGSPEGRSDEAAASPPGEAPEAAAEGPDGAEGGVISTVDPGTSFTPLGEPEAAPERPTTEAGAEVAVAGADGGEAGAARAAKTAETAPPGPAAYGPEDEDAAATSDPAEGADSAAAAPAEAERAGSAEEPVARESSEPPAADKPAAAAVAGAAAATGASGSGQTAAAAGPAGSRDASEERRKRPVRAPILLALVGGIAVAGAVVAVSTGGGNGNATSSAESVPPKPPAQVPAARSAPARPATPPAPRTKAAELTRLAMAPPKVHGTARLVGEPRTLDLRVRGLPGGHVYGVWLFNSVIDSVSLGEFQGRAAALRIPLPHDARHYRFVDISIQPTAANPNHSGESVMRVPLASLGRRA